MWFVIYVDGGMKDTFSLSFGICYQYFYVDEPVICRFLTKPLSLACYEELFFQVFKQLTF